VPKDPNRPKRGTTAFFFYLKHNRDDLNAKNPDLKVQDIAKIGGIEWGKMNEKAQGKYIAMADEDKARYTLRKIDLLQFAPVFGSV
jgi:hypothetical protein